MAEKTNALVRAKRTIVRFVVAIILALVACFSVSVNCDAISTPSNAEIYQEIPISIILTIIDEHIHKTVYRDILADRLANKIPYKELSEKYGYCERHIQRIVRDGKETITTVYLKSSK